MSNLRNRWLSRALSLAALLAICTLPAAAQQAGKKTGAPSKSAEAAFPAIDAHDAAIMKALNSTMKVNFTGQPMKEVLDHLEDKTKGVLTFIVDEDVLKDAMIDPKEFYNDPVTKIYRQPLKVRTFLKMILGERKMGYYLEDGNIMISRADKALNKMFVKLYPVSNLVGGEQLIKMAIRELQRSHPKGQLGPNSGLLGKNIDGLTGMIMGAVEPEYWKMSGNVNGPGTMQFVPSSGSLAIRASLEVHYLLVASGLLDNSQEAAVPAIPEPDPKTVTAKTYNLVDLGLNDPKKSTIRRAEFLKALNLVAADKIPAHAVAILGSELMVVRTTLENHRQIDLLLDQLGAVRSPGLPNPIGTSPFGSLHPNGGQILDLTGIDLDAVRGRAVNQKQQDQGNRKQAPSGAVPPAVSPPPNIVPPIGIPGAGSNPRKGINPGNPGGFNPGNPSPRGVNPGNPNPGGDDIFK